MRYTEIIDNCPLGWFQCHNIHTDSCTRGKWLCDWRCNRQKTCQKEFKETYEKYYKNRQKV